MTRSTSPDAPPRWVDLALTALFIAYALGIAMVLWRFLQMPAIDDERNYVRWFASVRAHGWLSALAEGYPVGYLALIRLAGGDWFFLTAGRLVAIVANGLLGLSLWKICERFGVSLLARRLALLTFLNLVLASHTWIFKTIADSVFTLVTLWVVVGIERAITTRRPGLAIATGAVWAGTFAMRPLAGLYAVAIVAGMLVLILRDTERRRALALASLATAVCAVGVLLLQTPALRTHGRLVFEQKTSARATWAQRRYLSLLVYEQHGTLTQLLRIPLVGWNDVDRYLEEHGAESLPRTNIETWRRDPARRLRQFAINVGFRTNFYLGLLLGVLYPLAWLVRTPPGRSRSPGALLVYAVVVLVTYTLAVNVLVSPFLEWRWILLPLIAAMGAGALALTRIASSNSHWALALVTVQIVMLSGSVVVWTVRAFTRTTF